MFLQIFLWCLGVSPSPPLYIVSSAMVDYIIDTKRICNILHNRMNSYIILILLIVFPESNSTSNPMTVSLKDDIRKLIYNIYLVQRGATKRQYKSGLYITGNKSDHL